MGAEVVKMYSSCLCTYPIIIIISIISGSVQIMLAASAAHFVSPEI